MNEYSNVLNKMLEDYFKSLTKIYERSVFHNRNKEKSNIETFIKVQNHMIISRDIERTPDKNPTMFLIEISYKIRIEKQIHAVDFLKSIYYKYQ